MQVSTWLRHASFVTTLNVYADYIAENEGGKQAPLTRPASLPVRAAGRWIVRRMWCSFAFGLRANRLDPRSMSNCGCTYPGFSS
jgi:hypothetical protein